LLLAITSLANTTGGNLEIGVVFAGLFLSKDTNMDNELELRVSQALVENQHLIDLLVKKNEVLEETIAEQALELETWHIVSNSDDWQEMSSIAKVLNYKGFGRNKIFEFLRGEKILRYNNEPYQEFVDRGYFKIIEQKVDLPYGTAMINKKTVVSQKGLDFIRRKLDDVAN
jgi:phage antirepressor YoqD-like protein